MKSTTSLLLIALLIFVGGGIVGAQLVGSAAPEPEIPPIELKPSPGPTDTSSVKATKKDIASAASAPSREERTDDDRALPQPAKAADDDDPDHLDEPDDVAEDESEPGDDSLSDG